MFPVIGRNFKEVIGEQIGKSKLRTEGEALDNLRPCCLQDYTKFLTWYLEETKHGMT